MELHIDMIRPTHLQLFKLCNSQLLSGLARVVSPSFPHVIRNIGKLGKTIWGKLWETKQNEVN